MGGPERKSLTCLRNVLCPLIGIQVQGPYVAQDLAAVLLVPRIPSAWNAISWDLLYENHIALLDEFEEELADEPHVAAYHRCLRNKAGLHNINMSNECAPG